MRSKTKKKCFFGRHGQTTLEYAMLAVMITGCLAMYPLMMNALGVYLRSMYVILTMAMP